MSDIHNDYDKFVAMLRKINFTNEDILIIDGDYLNRFEVSKKQLKMFNIDTVW